ncbi:MAG: DsbA family protein [Candidatus Undinarchaeales archaeon]|nr:DsbA family protein [Candidatus Undinarchaeales archaeon]MDP7494683.1 DsbA family protein [Candidatus Undinarchaeales archaeon]
MKERLEEVDEGIVEMNRRFTELEDEIDEIEDRLESAENGANAWMVAAMVLAAVMVIAAVGLSMGSIRVGATGTAPSAEGIPAKNVEAFVQYQLARGVPAQDVKQSLALMGVQGSAVDTIIQKETGGSTPPKATPKPTAAPTAAPTKAPTATPRPSAPSGTAKVTIVEYSDFQCPFCSRVVPTIEQIKATYGDKVNVIFKHFPLGFHENAQKAAEASECARDQGKFWEYHDILFDNQNNLGVSSLKGFAADLGLDTGTFNSCLDSDEKAQLVRDDMAEGQAKGISGTPGFFIQGTDANGRPMEEMISGAQPYPAFEEVIELILTGERASDNDPVVKLTVLNDETCDACDPSELIGVFRTQLFPTVQVTNVDISSAEGKKMIEDLDIKAVPAYIFDSSVQQAGNYDKVAQVLTKKGDLWVVSPGAVGAGKYLQPPGVDDDPFMGPEDAPVTIIEFTDFQCPFCQRVLPTLEQIMEEYPDKVRIVLRDFPLDQLHPQARNAHSAAGCANDQGKFWEFHDKVFANQQDVSDATLKGYAADLGLDTATFNDCVDSGKYNQEVQKDLEDGQEYGVSGTPAFFVNGFSISGAQPFAVFKDVIDKELAKVA